MKAALKLVPNLSGATQQLHDDAAVRAVAVLRAISEDGEAGASLKRLRDVLNSLADEELADLSEAFGAVILPRGGWAPVELRQDPGAKLSALQRLLLKLDEDRLEALLIDFLAWPEAEAGRTLRWILRHRPNAGEAGHD